MTEGPKSTKASASIEPTSLIQYEEATNWVGVYTSANFSDQYRFLKGLFVSESANSPAANAQRKESDNLGAEANQIQGSDLVFIQSWRNTDNISARLIEDCGDTLILECLLDKEMGEYEEREFSKSLFVGYDLSIGSLFYLRFFERQNESRLEIHNDPNLVLKEDFPKADFSALFKNSKLFKR